MEPNAKNNREEKQGKAKQGKRLAAGILAAALACGSMGAMAYGAGREQAADALAGPAAAERFFNQTAENPFRKDEETVYVIAAADGSVEKIIASDWLTKKEGGYEYETAETEGSLPVAMRVSYRLDGQEITPQEAAGANGRLTIRFEYENRLRQAVELGGEKEELYTPFAVLTGVILDADRVEGVEIANGRLLNDGERLIAVGLALPGLKENLIQTCAPGEEEDAITQKIRDLDIPEYVEITFQATDFELESTYTVVTNEIFSDVDGKALFDTQSLREDIDSLQEAMVRLTDGADALYDGLCTLSDKSGELAGGANRLCDGAAALSDGASALRDGAGELYAGSGGLVSGLSQLKESSDALNGGARQVFDALLSAAAGQLKAAGIDAGTLTADNYGGTLDQVLASLDADAVYNQAYAAAKKKVEEQVRANSGLIRAEVEKAVREAVEAQALTAVNGQLPEGGRLSPEQYGQLSGLPQEDAKAAVKAMCMQNGLEEAAATAMAEQAVRALQTIRETTEAQMSSQEIRQKIDTLTEEQIAGRINENLQSEAVMNQVGAAVESARAGAGQIAALKSQLDSYNAFYQGLLGYTAGVSQAADGASRLKDGAGSLADASAALEAGASQLKDGAGTMKEGTGALADGAAQLKDGAGELADGLKELDEEGIQKLAGLLKEDLQGLADRVQATLDLSKAYTSLDKEGTADRERVRFIYKTEAVR